MNLKLKTFDVLAASFIGEGALTEMTMTQNVRMSNVSDFTYLFTKPKYIVCKLASAVTILDFTVVHL